MRLLLFAVWVAQDWRVPTHLIEEVAIWAGLAGSGELRPWIVEGNPRAERAYAKAEFKRIGQRQARAPGRDSDPGRDGATPLDLDQTGNGSGGARTRGPSRGATSVLRRDRLPRRSASRPF